MPALSEDCRASEGVWSNQMSGPATMGGAETQANVIA